MERRGIWSTSFVVALLKASIIAWTMQLLNNDYDSSIANLRNPVARANVSACTSTANQLTTATPTVPFANPPSRPSHQPSPLQINPLNQLPPKPLTLLALLSLPLHSLERPLPPHIHRIITTLRKPVPALPIMRNDGAIHGATEVFADAPNQNPVGPRRAAVIDFPVLEDGEFQVRGGGVREGEVLVVVVCVRVSVAA